MKENLRHYLQSLFYGAPDTLANRALFEELLSNLNDRFDDQLTSGVPEEEAFARTIGELGDIRPLFEKADAAAGAAGETDTTETGTADMNAAGGETPSTDEAGAQESTETPSADEADAHESTETQSADEAGAHESAETPSGGEAQADGTAPPPHTDTDTAPNGEAAAPPPPPAAAVRGGTGKYRLPPCALRRYKYQCARSVSLAVMCFIAWLVPSAFDYAVPVLFACAAAAGTILLILQFAGKPDIADDSARCYDPETRHRDAGRARVLLAFGVGIVILSIIAPMVLWDSLGIAVMFAMITLGVGMIVFSANIRPRLAHYCRYAPEGALPLADARARRRGNGWIVALVIVPFLALLLIVAALLARFSFRFSPFGAFGWSDAETGNGTVAASDVSTLDVTWRAGEVRVEPYAGDRILFEETRNGVPVTEEPMAWRLRDGKLEIRFEKPKWLVFGRQTEKELTIRLPADALVDCSIDSTSAGISVRDITLARALDLDATTGQLTVERVRAQSFSADVTSGTIAVTESFFGAVDVDATSGEVRIRDSACGILKLDMTSGTFALVDSTLSSAELDGTSADFYLQPKGITREFEIDGTSGDVTLVIPEEWTGYTLYFDGRYISDDEVTQTGNRRVWGDGSVRIEIDTTSGSCTLRRRPNTTE